MDWQNQQSAYIMLRHKMNALPIDRIIERIVDENGFLRFDNIFTREASIISLNAF